MDIRRQTRLGRQFPAVGLVCLALFLFVAGQAADRTTLTATRLILKDGAGRERLILRGDAAREPVIEARDAEGRVWFKVALDPRGNADLVIDARGGAMISLGRGGKARVFVGTGARDSGIYVIDSAGKARVKLLDIHESSSGLELFDEKGVRIGLVVDKNDAVIGIGDRAGERLVLRGKRGQAPRIQALNEDDEVHWQAPP